ncbi:MAG: hypothetical protein ACREKL_15430 [Chthoniobacterales bacterium]
MIRFPHRALVTAAGCLLATSSLRAAGEQPIATGLSTVVRKDVNFALFVPPDLAGDHGPAGIFVFFGGKNDSIEMYQQSLATVAQTMDLILIVPQMPWFADPGKVPEAGVIRALEQLVPEIEKQFHTTSSLIVVGGASAGGPIAAQLANKWSAKVALLVLASTPVQPDARKKTLHVVAASESELLGPDAKRAPILGKGKKDIFAIPGGHHTAQVEYLQPWLETEVTALRLDLASQTTQAASQALMQRNSAKAEAILNSTHMGTLILSTQVPGTNSFYEYENARRKALVKKYEAPTQSVDKLREKIAAQK